MAKGTAVVLGHDSRHVGLTECAFYTDEYLVYDSLGKEGYQHDRVHHAEEV